MVSSGRGRTRAILLETRANLCKNVVTENYTQESLDHWLCSAFLLETSVDSRSPFSLEAGPRRRCLRVRATKNGNPKMMPSPKNTNSDTRPCVHSKW